MKNPIAIAALLMLAVGCATPEDSADSSRCSDPYASPDLPSLRFENGAPACPGADSVRLAFDGTILACEWCNVRLACEPDASFYVSRLYAFVDGAWRPAVGGDFVDYANAPGVPACD